MGRKVFISFLGTGRYEECYYGDDGFCSSLTPYIQIATIEYLIHKGDWNEDSKGFILLTKKARETHWDGKLKEKIEAKQLPFAFEGIDIKDGKNEEEMWQIFQTVFELLEDGDELHIDLTHSFRYLPMLMLVLSNYAKFLKGVKVSSLTYGNYEARNPETNIAPIVNLLPLSALQDWTYATADFLENGNAKRIKEMEEKFKENLWRKGKINNDNRGDVDNLHKLVSAIDTFSSEINTCRGVNIYKGTAINNVRKNLDAIQNEVLPQLNPVFEKLKDSIKGFSGGVNNMFEAVRWSLEKKQYQQAVTFLEEGIITYFCLRHNISITDRDRRELVTFAAKIIAEGLPESEWRVKEEDDLKKLKELLLDAELQKLAGRLSAIASFRNDFNHCGMREERNMLASRMIDRINKHTNIIDTIRTTENQESLEAKEPCFINFSNHPIDQWEESQMSAAQKYGELLEISFPDIDARADESEIQRLTEEYTQKILSLAGDKHPTVHIMGEMTFVFSMVKELKELGIDCVASTTERNVEMIGNGERLSKFRFVCFRKY